MEQVSALAPYLERLTPDQFTFIDRLVKAMVLGYSSRRSDASDLMPTDRSMDLFFIHLVTHHTLYTESFKKEKFEYAVEQVMTSTGRTAARPKSRTNPGLDLTVDGERWSFKTEAHSGIKPESIHISKWMELGKGRWESEDDLPGLADRFLRHLEGYDRIFVLRCLTPDDPVNHRYEILEIPKGILTTCRSAGVFTMMHNSTQTPKPGYCRVSDATGLRFELYFDGGSERKLRLQKLRRDLCTFHAEWQFQTPQPPPAETPEEEAGSGGDEE
jgi:type II restriction enzyme